MRAIQVSQEVWQAIAQRGKFGESEDDVLRRVFDLPAQDSPVATTGRPLAPAVPPAQNHPIPKRRVATSRMSSYVRDSSLVVEFAGGKRQTFGLPKREDKSALRRVRDQAVEFAKRNGASYGQEMAVKKALTEAGYHLMK